MYRFNIFWHRMKIIFKAYKTKSSYFADNLKQPPVWDYGNYKRLTSKCQVQSFTKKYLKVHKNILTARILAVIIVKESYLEKSAVVGSMKRLMWTNFNRYRFISLKCIIFRTFHEKTVLSEQHKTVFSVCVWRRFQTEFRRQIFSISKDIIFFTYLIGSDLEYPTMRIYTFYQISTTCLTSIRMSRSGK